VEIFRNLHKRLEEMVSCLAMTVSFGARVVVFALRLTQGDKILGLKKHQRGKSGMEEIILHLHIEN